VANSDVVADELIDIMAHIDVPESPPVFARAGQPVGMAFLDLALSLNHVVRESEHLKLTDRRFLSRQISVDINLDRLTSSQRSAGLQYGERRLGSLGRGRDWVAFQDVTRPNSTLAAPGPADSAKAETGLGPKPGSVPPTQSVNGAAGPAGPDGPSPLIWVPVAMLGRRPSTVMEFRDSEGRTVPRATQEEVLTLLHAAFYQLFRHLLSVAAPSFPPVRDFRFGPERRPRWLLQQAITTLIWNGSGQAHTAGPPKSSSNPHRWEASRIVKNYMKGNVFWEPFLQLLYTASNEYVIVAGLPSNKVEHSLTYNMPGVPEWRPLRRRVPPFSFLPWWAGDEYVVEYQRNVPHSLRSFHVTFEAEPGVSVRRGILRHERDQEQLDTLTEDMAFLSAIADRPRRTLSSAPPSGQNVGDSGVGDGPTVVMVDGGIENPDLLDYEAERRLLKAAEILKARLGDCDQIGGAIAVERRLVQASLVVRTLLQVGSVGWLRRFSADRRRRSRLLRLLSRVETDLKTVRGQAVQRSWWKRWPRKPASRLDPATGRFDCGSLDELASHLRAYEVGSGALASDDARDNLCHLYLRGDGSPRRKSGTYSVKVAALLADEKPSMVNQVLWVCLAMTLTTAAVGVALLGGAVVPWDPEEMPGLEAWQSVSGAVCDSPVRVACEWVDARVSQLDLDGGYGGRSLDAADGVVAVVAVALGLALSRLELPKAQSVLARLRRRARNLVILAAAAEVYLLIAVVTTRTRDVANLAPHFHRALGWLAVVTGLALGWVVVGNVLSKMTRLNVASAPVWLGVGRLLPRHVLLFVPFRILFRVFSFSSPHSAFDAGATGVQADRERFVRSRGPNRISRAREQWLTLLERRSRTTTAGTGAEPWPNELGEKRKERVRQVIDELTARRWNVVASTQLRVAPRRMQVVLDGRVRLNSVRNKAEYAIIEALGHSVEVVNRVDVVIRRRTNLLASTVITISLALVARWLGLHWLVVAGASAVVMVISVGAIERLRAEHPSRVWSENRASELAASAATGLRNETTEIGIGTAWIPGADLSADELGSAVADREQIWTELGLSAGPTKGRVMSYTLAPESDPADEFEDGHHQLVFPTNPAFLYDNARFVEVYVGAPEDLWRRGISDGEMRVRHAQALGEMVEELSLLARQMHAPILFMEAPACCPAVELDSQDYKATGQAVGGVGGPRRVLHPGVRCRVALTQRSLLYRHYFRRRVLEIAETRGWAVWFEDRRSTSGRAWLKYADGGLRWAAPRDRHMVDEQEQQRIKGFIPLTAVGPARTGVTYRLVSHLRSSMGIVVGGASVKALQDHAVITLWLPTSFGLGEGPDRPVLQYDLRRSAPSGPQPPTGPSGALPTPAPQGEDHFEFVPADPQKSQKSFAEELVAAGVFPEPRVTSTHPQGNLEGFRVVVGPTMAAEPSKWHPDRQPTGSAFWAIWDVRTGSVGAVRVYEFLRQAWKETYEKEPLLEYAIVRDAYRGRHVGRFKLRAPTPAAIDQCFGQPTLDQYCRTVESNWRKRVAGDDPSAEVQLTWRETNLGRWATLR
jgi:hypothetical protein